MEKQRGREGSCLCTCGASWRRCHKAQTCAQLWWRAACVVPLYRLWIYVLSASSSPCCALRYVLKEGHSLCPISTLPVGEGGAMERVWCDHFSCASLGARRTHINGGINSGLRLVVLFVVTQLFDYIIAFCFVRREGSDRYNSDVNL